MLEQLNAHMETDDNDNEARIASQYRMLTMHDPEFLVIPEADDDSGCTQGSEQFKEAIRKEVTDLEDPPCINTGRGQGNSKVLADRHHTQVQAEEEGQRLTRQA